MLLSSHNRGPLCRFLPLLLAALPWLQGCERTPAARPAAGPSAQAGPAAAAPLVTLGGVAEPATARPGATLTVAWTLEAAAGWHTYGNVRNDSGFAPRQRLLLPPGWEAGPLQWPAPVRHLSAGDILDHVYEGRAVLLQEVRVPAGAPAGRHELRAHWEWLACRESCVPGRDSLVVAVTVAGDAEPAPPPSAALAAARARLPRPLPDGLVRIERDGDIVRITPVGVDADAGDRQLVFVPALDCGELADVLRDAVGPRLALRLLPQEGRLGPLRGLLLVETAGGGAGAYTIDIPAAPQAAS